MARPPDARAGRRRWALVAAAALLVLGGAVMLVGLQRSILFPRSHIPLPSADWPRPPGLVRVDVAHADGHSEGWFLPGDGVTPASPGPVVFFAHGNGGLIDYAAPGLEPYRRRGISVAMVEYRGYNRSGGEPSQAALFEDIARFYDAIVARPEVAGGQVIAHGRSLGGGVMCGLVEQRPVRGLVLESTFRSVKVIARRFLLPGIFVSDPFDNEAVVARFEKPLLILHGTHDEIVPFAHGQTLARVAADPGVQLVEFASGHNDMPMGDRYWAAIDGLLARALHHPAP